MGAITPFEIVSKNGHRILLRSATLADASAIMQLSYEVISENDTLITTVEEFNITETQQMDFIHLLTNSPSSCMIVAEYNHSIIGILTFQCGSFKKYSHHGIIGMIVDKNWRGKGVGSALLTSIIDWANSQPLLEKLCLEVLASNKSAIFLYKKYGFIEEGRQIKQVKKSHSHYDDLILMAKHLTSSRLRQ